MEENNRESPISDDLHDGMQLFQASEMPPHFQEVHILSGYRHPRSTPIQCLMSIFHATNETVNFWTHFIPGVYFLWWMGCLRSEHNFVFDPYTWPLLVFLFSAFAFPMMSAFAHLFNAVSDEGRHVCFFLDYAALSLYSLGTAIAYRVYVFPAALLNSYFASVYLPIAIFNAFWSLPMSCQSRFMPNGFLRKMMRVVAFSVPYWFDSTPLIYRLLYCSQDKYATDTALHYHFYQFVLALSSAVLYILHAPECLFPGKFDIYGHSHQLFHITSVIGTYLQINGVIEDMVTGREHLNPGYLVLFLSVVIVVIVSVINVFVLMRFVDRLYHPRSTADREFLAKEHDATCSCCNAENGVVLDGEPKESCDCGTKVDSSFVNGTKEILMEPVYNHNIGELTSESKPRARFSHGDVASTCNGFPATENIELLPSKTNKAHKSSSLHTD